MTETWTLTRTGPIAIEYDALIMLPRDTQSYWSYGKGYVLEFALRFERDAKYECVHDEMNGISTVYRNGYTYSEPVRHFYHDRNASMPHFDTNVIADEYTRWLNDEHNENHPGGLFGWQATWGYSLSHISLPLFQCEDKQLAKCIYPQWNPAWDL